MFHFIAPVGTSIPPGDLVKIAWQRINESTDCDLISAMKEHSGRKHIFLTNSGRSAQFLILRALADQKNLHRQEVIVPAYTCYTVAASIVKAGLKIRPVDVNPNRMDYCDDQLRAVDYSSVLAINASNLFGVVSDMKLLSELANQHDVALIDDAAQSLGSSFEDIPSGSAGRAGFYSLDRGKNLPAYSGGIIVTDDDEFAARINDALLLTETDSLFSELAIFVKIMASAILLHPKLYWLPSSLPFLGLGQTIFDEQFKVGHLSRIQEITACHLYKKLTERNEKRACRAHELAKKIIELDGYEIPGYDSDKPRVYLRLPVLAPNSQTRDKVVTLLSKAGIGSTSMYPDRIDKITGIEKNLSSGLGEFPGAQTLVDRLFTLPTHSYVTKRDVIKIVECLNRIVN